MVCSPTCDTARVFMDLGAAVVREVAKMSAPGPGAGAAQQPRVVYDAGQNLVVVR